jgi:hypothetical protein
LVSARLPPRLASRLVPWLSAGACACITIVVLYPGQYPFDSAYQLWQARSGRFGNGSPVAMIALWALLLEATADPAALFCLNVALFWSGLALCVIVIAEHALARVALLVALGMTPLVLAEMAHVLTDAHLAAVLMLATGFAACGLATRQRAPLLGGVALLIYAGCIRHNALIAILPYGALAAPALIPVRARGATIAVSGALLIALLSGATAFVLDRTMVVQRYTVWPAIALWDLSAISVDRNTLLLPTFTHGSGLTVDELRETGAFDPTANTFLFQKSHSGMRDGLQVPYMPAQLRELRAAWTRAVLQNPTAYARHRLRTFWLLIGPHRGGVQGLAYFQARTPYRDNPPLPAPAAPGAQAAFYRLAGALSSGWMFSALPCLVLGAVAWVVAWRRRNRLNARVALAVSSAALLYAMAFLPLAPAADLRYLTWPIVAGPLALAFALSRRASVGQ